MRVQARASGCLSVGGHPGRRRCAASAADSEPVAGDVPDWPGEGATGRLEGPYAPCEERRRGAVTEMGGMRGRRGPTSRRPVDRDAAGHDGLRV